MSTIHLKHGPNDTRLCGVVGGVATYSRSLANCEKCLNPVDALDASYNIVNGAYWIIQHHVIREVPEKCAKWDQSNFDSFGTPPTFRDYIPYFKYVCEDVNAAIYGLEWIREKHPDHEFRLRRVHILIEFGETLA
jgi:hypothetical protein